LQAQLFGSIGVTLADQGRRSPGDERSDGSKPPEKWAFRPLFLFLNGGLESKEKYGKAGKELGN
jgi:hypothetical protein